MFYDIPVKYISPIALLGLILGQILADAKKCNGYNDYPNWLHGIAGGLVLGFLVLSLLTFVIYPDFWDVMGVDEQQGAQVAYYAVCPLSYMHATLPVLQHGIGSFAAVQRNVSPADDRTLF